MASDGLALLITFSMATTVEADVQPADIQLASSCFARCSRFVLMRSPCWDGQKSSDDNDKQYH
jgi:hypothetical protein